MIFPSYQVSCYSYVFQNKEVKQISSETTQLVWDRNEIRSQLIQPPVLLIKVFFPLIMLKPIEFSFTLRHIFSKRQKLVLGMKKKLDNAMYSGPPKLNPSQ